MHSIKLIRRDSHVWELPRTGEMRAAAVIFASEQLLAALESSAIRQLRNVCTLPGIAGQALLMPDAHHGFGFPIGGVAAFDPGKGVVSAGGVGFDIACGVRTLHTGLCRDDILAAREALADNLFAAVPSGAGRGGRFMLEKQDMDDMLTGGASWAVGFGLGTPDDLAHAEERGRLAGADPKAVSARAKKRFTDQLGTLGSGNHYLELQYVDEILDQTAATVFGLKVDDALLSIHCGSRGLGHQIATDYVAAMTVQAKKRNIALPDRNLACAPINSELGQSYLKAMRCGVNAALANRQAITHLVRHVMSDMPPIGRKAELRLLYDVSHNTCKEETHEVKGREQRLFVHRKGATRAFGPGHADLPPDYATAGQPVLVGGSMGTPSYILTGTTQAMDLTFGSACHGAGRALSRTKARKLAKGKDVVQSLRHQGIIVRTHSFTGIAEEAPQAYKDINCVISATADAGLALPVARLRPLVCIKG